MPRRSGRRCVEPSRNRAAGRRVVEGVTAVPPPLTEARLLVAVRDLAAADPALGAVVERFGPPPLWARRAGLPDARPPDPRTAGLARLGTGRLRPAPRRGRSADPGDHSSASTTPSCSRIGFSRQKTRYARALATAVEDGSLDIEGLAALGDDDVDAALTALPGIGPWTATIYRLMVLLRPDAWPVHDIALAQALAELRGLDARPDAARMLELADEWRPRRAVAARILWHHYLSTPRPGSVEDDERVDIDPAVADRTDLDGVRAIRREHAPEDDPPVAVGRRREVDGRDQHAVDADLRVAAVG